MKRLTLLTAFLALGFVASCSARRGEPLTGPLALSEPSLVRGQETFMHHCHQCHPGGESGLGPAINDKPLPRFLIRLQVRNGVGAMPAFSEEEIPSEELTGLIDYLKALRRHGQQSRERGFAAS